MHLKKFQPTDISKTDWLMKSQKKFEFANFLDNEKTKKKIIYVFQLSILNIKLLSYHYVKTIGCGISSLGATKCRYWLRKSISKPYQQALNIHNYLEKVEQKQNVFPVWAVCNRKLIPRWKMFSLGHKHMKQL